MFTGATKIVKPEGQEADEFEQTVAQELFNLEVSIYFFGSKGCGERDVFPSVGIERQRGLALVGHDESSGCVELCLRIRRIHICRLTRGGIYPIFLRYTNIPRDPKKLGRSSPLLVSCP